MYELNKAIAYIIAIVLTVMICPSHLGSVGLSNFSFVSKWLKLGLQGVGLQEGAGLVDLPVGVAQQNVWEASLQHVQAQERRLLHDLRWKRRWRCVLLGGNVFWVNHQWGTAAHP